MATIIKKIWRRAFSITAESVAKRYIRKDRNYSYKGLRLRVLKDVFHPGLFRSTKIFAGWLEQKQLANTYVLELGCGSALLSLIAASKGAKVTAVDINSKAVANAEINARQNNLNISAIQSDLFSALPASEVFDMVLINPPYFPKAPASDYDHAWYCGENFEYFHKLFRQIKQRSSAESYYMILSDSCDLKTINQIAAMYSVSLNEEFLKKVSGEQFIIYRIKG